jgi:SET domain-containing protein
MNILPHEGVWTRLKPSKIHGVGVFAIIDIPKGTDVFPHDDQPIVWIDEKQIERLPIALRQLYDDFCIIKGHKYGCPKHFDGLTTSWYLNHSDNPNVSPNREYKFYTLRDIKAGEELMANYSEYSDEREER